ncbi:MAG: hypothetical protein ACLQAH_15615 [Limisphaerales bacterium]
MKPHFHHHSCPQCGHYVGWRRLHFGSRYTEWACESCGSQICYDAKSKWLSALVVFAWCILTGLLFMRFHLINWLGFVPLMLAGMFPTVGVLRVTLAQPSRTPSPDLREPAKDA